MSEYNLLIQIAPFLVTFAIGLIGGWAVVKKKITSFRKLIDDVDDAVRDDSVTESEFRKIWNSAIDVIYK
jgi:hypothetical protein